MFYVLETCIVRNPRGTVKYCKGNYILLRTNVIYCNIKLKRQVEVKMKKQNVRIDENVIYVILNYGIFYIILTNLFTQLLLNSMYLHTNLFLKLNLTQTS